MYPIHLIQRIKRADSDALQYLYNHCKAYCIGRLCRSNHCPPTEAEDIFMDALLIFRENVMRGKLTEVTHLRAYLYRICENCYQEQLRHEVRCRQSEDAVRSSLYEPAPLLPDDFPRKKELVMQAFRYLGTNCRCILQYYYFDQLPLDEIAKKMNMANPNVAKVTKSRCYKKWVEAVADLKQKR